jgi:dCMP deaminase
LSEFYKRLNISFKLMKFGLKYSRTQHLRRGEKMKRIDKHNYYLDICETILERGTCIRRNFAAIIVKNDEIMSTGYSGAPRGRANCSELGFCRREELKVPRGTRYELCRSVHAEQNAIISARRQDMIGATLYLVGKEIGTNKLVENASPCSLCKRFIINSGIEKVIIRDTDIDFRIVDVQYWIDNDDSLVGDGSY